MNWRLRISDGLAEVPEPAWRELAAGHPAMRLELLKAIEHAASRPLTLRTFLLEDDAGPAAAALCEPVTAPGDHNRLDSFLFGRGEKAARLLGLSTRPVLAFSPPMGSEPALLLRDAEPAERSRIVGGLLDGIEAHAAERGHGVAFMWIPCEDEALTGALRDRGYLETEVLPPARLDIAWSDFDGYAAFLARRSKAAARNARHERRRNRDVGVRIRLVPNDAVDTEAFYALARDHYLHKNSEEPEFGPDFLPRLNRELGDDFLVFEAERDGRPLAMSGIVRSGNVGWGACFGIDLRNRLKEEYTYFNLLYYHLADCAADLGLKTMLYGISAYKAKLARGCRLMESRLFYKPHRSLIRIAAAPFFRIHGAWYRRKGRQ